MLNRVRGFLHVNELVLHANLLSRVGSARRLTHTSRPRLHHARTVPLVGHHGPVRWFLYLPWQHAFWRGEVVRWVHFLEDWGHTMLCVLFFAHLRKLALGNGRLLITLLESLVCQEVLSHDAWNLSEVVKDRKACILYFLLWRAKLTKLVVHVKGGLWHRNSIKEEIKVIKAVIQGGNLVGVVIYL